HSLCSCPHEAACEKSERAALPEPRRARFETSFNHSSSPLVRRLRISPSTKAMAAIEEADEAIPAECGKVLDVLKFNSKLFSNGYCLERERIHCSTFLAKAGFSMPSKEKFSLKFSAFIHVASTVVLE